MVAAGWPTVVGLYLSHYRFNGFQYNLDFGYPDYDHIVPVVGITSTHVYGSDYDADDVLHITDNGTWQTPGTAPQYHFSLPFEASIRDRRSSNNILADTYSVPFVANYGIAITGIDDVDHETLPVRLTTDIDYEPAIAPGADTPPAPVPLLITVHVAGLAPHVDYRLYCYDDFDAVPVKQFNANSARAVAAWDVRISEGSSTDVAYRTTTDKTAVFHAVRADGP